MEGITIPIGDKDQVTLTAPTMGVLAVRRLDKDNVRVYLLPEKTLRSVLGEEQVEFAREAMEFSVEQGIQEEVEKAVQAARLVFGDAERVTVTLKRDEYGESYVDIGLVIQDEPEDEAKKYSDCMVKWASFMSPTASGKIHLTTSWGS